MYPLSSIGLTRSEAAPGDNELASAYCRWRGQAPVGTDDGRPPEPGTLARLGPAWQNDSMTEKMLTIRLAEQEHRALKLFAVAQGRSVNSVVSDLIRAELDRHAPNSGGRTQRSREEFVAQILRRAGIDPDSAEHRAAVQRADAAVERVTKSHRGQGAA